jgi:hypothetical protein
VSDDTRHILVVANETSGSSALVDLIEEKAKDGPIQVTVLAPVTQPRQGYVVYYDTRRARRAGASTGRSTPSAKRGFPPRASSSSPIRSRAPRRDPPARAGRDHRLTHPQKQSGWLRRNMVDQMHRVAGSIPFEHVSSTSLPSRARPTSSSSRTRPCSASRCSGDP